MSAARHLLEHPPESLLPDRMEDARLVVSELVANAVRHGLTGRDLELMVRWDGTCLHLEVRSAGPFHLRARDEPNPEGGWGLVLVDALADRWGVRSGPTTTVWAELENHR